MVDVINAIRTSKSTATSRVDWDVLLQKCSERDAAVTAPTISKLEEQARLVAEEKRLLQEAFEREKAERLDEEQQMKALLSSREQKLLQEHIAQHGKHQHSRRRRKEQVSRRPVFQAELLRKG